MVAGVAGWGHGDIGGGSDSDTDGGEMMETGVAGWGHSDIGGGDRDGMTGTGVAVKGQG